MPKNQPEEGDIVTISGTVTHVHDDDPVRKVTVRLDGHGPVTLADRHVTVVEKAKRPKRTLYDVPD